MPDDDLPKLGDHVVFQDGIQFFHGQIVGRKPGFYHDNPAYEVEGFHEGSEGTYRFCVFYHESNMLKSRS